MRRPIHEYFWKGGGGVQGAIDIGQGGKGYWQQVKKTHRANSLHLAGKEEGKNDVKRNEMRSRVA